MRIRLSGEGHNIQIPVPTRMIFSKFSVWLYLNLARKLSSRASRYVPENVEISVDEILEKLPDEAVYALSAEIMRIKRKYGHWNLVEVKSADGEEVTITL